VVFGRGRIDMAVGLLYRRAPNDIDSGRFQRANRKYACGLFTGPRAFVKDETRDKAQDASA